MPLSLAVGLGFQWVIVIIVYAEHHATLLLLYCVICMCITVIQQFLNGLGGFSFILPWLALMETKAKIFVGLTTLE